MNPRMMRKLQQQMNQNTIPALEVIIRTADKEYYFVEPAVMAMDLAGQKTYQVIGEPQVRSPTSGGSSTPAEPMIPEEDIQLVMDQTGSTAEQAKAALKACNGQPAEAILKLLG